MSVYGDVAVDYISPEGKTTRVGMVNGLAIYTPTPKRFFTIAVNQLPGVDFRKGSLHVTYRYDASKDKKLAEESIVLR